MARTGVVVEWGRGGGGRCCSYKRTTFVVCCLNLVAALYVLRSLYTSYYIFSSSSSSSLDSKYTDEQIQRMEESIGIRKASEPVELVKLVRKLKKKLSREGRVLVLSQPMKQKVAGEILQRLKELDSNASAAEHQEALEKWRLEKLQEIKRMGSGNVALNSTISLKEAEILKRALESNWLMLLEDVGYWIPVPVINKKGNVTEEELEEEIIAGPPVPAECHAEIHADYGGAAVRWGLTHHKETAADCCQACLDQAKHAKPGEIKCNIWVYCPSETGCFSPDKYEHRHQECWLKQADAPKLNFKDKYSESYRSSHPTAPLIVPWMSGVIGP